MSTRQMDVAQDNRKIMVKWVGGPCPPGVASAAERGHPMRALRLQARCVPSCPPVRPPARPPVTVSLILPLLII